MHENAESAERLLGMLANRHRLLVLCSLIENECSVGELLAKSTLGQSALSQHLAKLRDAGMVTTRRDGQVIYYRLTDRNARKLIEALCALYEE